MAYWHRSHQLRGVQVCHQHLEPLIESHVDVSSRINSQVFQPAETISLEKSQPVLQQGNETHRIYLAKAAHFLLNTDVPVPELETLRERYLSLLRRKGLVKALGKVSQTDFIRSFRDFYGADFLAELGCDVDEKERSNWLSSLVRTPRSAKHPLYHLLLMQFLDVSPAEFLLGDFSVDFKPFGDPPYPCLNAVAPHYLKPIIPQVEVTRNKGNGLPLGLFRCSCGFTYVRTGPDKSEKDRFKRTRIISVGPLWREALVRFSEEANLTLKEIARRLGVDPKIVKLYRHRLQEESLCRVDESEVLLGNHREKLLKVIEQNPSISRQEIKTLIEPTYVWLYRHDREWLFNNLPERKRARKKHSRIKIDWEAKDANMCIRARETIEELLNETGRPKRISHGRVGRKMKEPCIINNDLGRFPKTKAFLEEQCENVETFQVRRVRWAISQMVEEGEPIVKWRLIRRAGLGSACSERVLEEIGKLLAVHS